MTPSFSIGESFPVQFIWKLPNGDFARAIFTANVLDLQHREDRYLVRLEAMLGGLQESSSGQALPIEKYSKQIWKTIVQLTGRKVQLAYESADSKPIYLRYTTLTGENKFFTRFLDEA